VSEAEKKLSNTSTIVITSTITQLHM